MTASFTVLVVYNPLDARCHAAHTVPWGPDLSLGAYLRDLPPGTEWGVALNGEALAPEDWDAQTIAPADTLVVVPIPEGGGGGGKTILRLVGMIAIAALAAWAGPAIAAGLAADGLIAAGSVGVVGAFAGGVIPPVGRIVVGAPS